MNIEKEITEIKEFLASKEEVLLSFIFGSFIEGRLTEESDIDIAILFKNKPDFSFLIDIMDRINQITGREADIVILNEASPIIKMQVLKKGKLLKKINDKTYNDFFLRTVKEYDDIKRIRRPQEENILRGRIYVRT